MPRSRPGPAIINDVRGLTGDPGLASLIAERGAGLILMASERGGADGAAPGRDAVMDLLEESLRIATQAGIDP